MSSSEGKNNVKVSILVPSYNSAHYLPQAIDSVLEQTFKDYEILIIDDGSTDGTKAVVDKYIEIEPKKVRYIYQKNQGLACARNTGLREARGSLIALLDADDAWLPERLEETVRAIESDEAIGLVHANIKRITVDGKEIDVPNREKKYLSGKIFNHIFLRKAHISCPTVLFRKDCCTASGLFDPYLARLGCEDRDLWLRVSRDHKIQYIDKVLALYRISKGSMSHDGERMLKARLYVIEKYCSTKREKQILKRRALAKIYRDLGDNLLYYQKFRDSRAQYLKALSYWPFSVWTWINLLKAVLNLVVQTKNKEFNV